MPSRQPQQPLTPAQQELYDWLAGYIGQHRHSPSIRQMMEAMGLRSPAPIQSRLRHLQQKGWLTWQEGQARTLQLLGEAAAAFGGAPAIPVLGAVAAGGLVETFDDVQESLDLAPLLATRGLFALTVNGDSMVDAHIADGDVVLLEPVPDPARLRNGTIVSALVAGSGTTLKHFQRQGGTVILEAANPAYAPIELPAEQVTVQGKLVALRVPKGAIAQLVEHLHGMQGVSGSSPLGSIQSDSLRCKGSFLLFGLPAEPRSGLVAQKLSPLARMRVGLATHQRERTMALHCCSSSAIRSSSSGKPGISPRCIPESVMQLLTSC
jgi:repressor LexA